VLLIFQLSRIVVTSAPEDDDVVDGFSRVYLMLNRFFVRGPVTRTSNQLSGCCDLHINHAKHCPRSAALTCRIASGYFWSYWPCGYVKFWLDAVELVWVYLRQLHLTWLASWVS